MTEIQLTPGDCLFYWSEESPTVVLRDLDDNDEDCCIVILRVIGRL